MTFHSLRTWLRPATRKAGPPHRSCQNHVRPRLEELECRNLLSTLTVLNNADSGAGSLRDTIAAAQPGDTILFDPGLTGQTITLTGGELDINKNLDIEGLGADQLAVSGDDSSRVFHIESGVSAEIDDLTLTQGHADNGGGIWNAGGTLSTFEHNLAVGGQGGNGGDGLGDAGHRTHGGGRAGQRRGETGQATLHGAARPAGKGLLQQSQFGADIGKSAAVSVA